MKKLSLLLILTLGLTGLSIDSHAASKAATPKDDKIPKCYFNPAPTSPAPGPRADATLELFAKAEQSGACAVTFPGGGGFYLNQFDTCENCKAKCEAFYPNGTVEDGTKIECGTTTAQQ
jgi:hypothetical protein